MKVNAILNEIKSDNITETNQINLWEENQAPSQTKEEMQRKSLVAKKITKVNTRVTKHISILERKKREEIKKKEKYKVIELKYRVKKKGLNVVLEELKQRIQAKATKIKSMIKEVNSIELTDCSNKINKECTNS